MPYNFNQMLLTQILRYMFKEKFEFEKNNEESGLDAEIKKILERISNLMDGGTRIFKILLHYDESVTIADTELISQALLKNQLDYFNADFKSAHNSDFEILVLPPCSINDEMLDFIKTLGEKNIKVLNLMKPEFLPGIKKAAVCENFKICKDVNDLILKIITYINPDVLLKKEADIFYIKKEFEKEYRYLFVNAGNSGVNTSAELYIENTSNETEYKITFYNLLKDKKTAVNAGIKNGKIVFDLRIPAYEALIVEIKK